MDWDRVQQLFDSASALSKPEADAFLARECAGDKGLGSTVASLLEEAASDPAAFLQQLVETGAGAAGDSPDRVGQQFGPYAIERRIGMGGMGEVYLARRTDAEFEHLIALKILRPGLAFGEMLNRFRQERQILARLDHPNIVRLLDGGSTPEGLPYLAMDYVEGVPISEYCDRQKLDAKARCGLMRQVCDAVAHAHRHLIIHRDLKPANILVTPAGVPKLLDFGIAKLLGSEGPSGGETAWRPLTPDYASPEQIAGGALTTASDVYQLGVILRKLLVKPGWMAGDLERIVNRAMHVEPVRRYGSAQELAEDLQRFLDRRPVLARPDSVFYSARKWIERSPLAAAALAMALLSACIGAGVSYDQGQRAKRRFEQVRSLSSTFIFEFDERIRDLPGSLAARTYAVDTAIRHLDSLAREASGDISLETELASAYVTAAKIQGDPSMPNLGKSDLAVASLDKAIQLANDVLRSQPDHLPALRALCAGLRGRALMVGTVRRQRKEGMEIYRQAVAVADRMERQTAALTGVDYRVISEVHTRLADFLAPAAPAEAKGHFEKSLAMNALALETGGNSEDRVGRVAPLVGLARINRDLGNTPEVVRELEAATAILEPMLATDPNSQRTKRQLGLVLQDLARAFGSPRSFHINQRARAVETVRKALSLRQSEDRPGQPRDIDVITSRAMMHLDLAAMLVQSDPAASLSAVESALGWTAAILARNPTDARTARIQHTLEEELANTRLQLGQPALALAILEPFHAFYVAALKKDPEDMSLLDGFGKIQSTRAKALTALARWTEAEAALTAAEADTARVAAKYGDDLYFLRNRAWVLEAFGDFWRVHGDTAKSEGYYRRALEIWARWARIVPAGHPYPELFASALKRKLSDPKNPALVARILDR